jgi:hypothetical protein
MSRASPDSDNRLLDLGLSELALADPLAAPEPADPIALPIATTPPVSGGNASPFYYERFFAFFPALPISANGTSLSLTCLALRFLSDGMSGNDCWASDLVFYDL